MSLFYSAGLGGSAIPDGLVDSFETDQYDNQNNSLSDYYSGELTEASRTQDQTTARDGDYYLQLNTTSGEAGIISNDGDGLNNYPTSSDTLRAWIHPQGQDVGFFFGVEDGSSYNGFSTNGYLVWIRQASNEFRLNSGDGSNNSNLFNISQTIDSNWYEVRINRGDSMEIELLDDTGSSLDTQTLTNSDHTNANGIGWFANNNTGSTTTYHDFMRVV